MISALTQFNTYRYNCTIAGCHRSSDRIAVYETRDATDAEKCHRGVPNADLTCAAEQHPVPWFVAFVVLEKLYNSCLFSIVCAQLSVYVCCVSEGRKPSQQVLTLWFSEKRVRYNHRFCCVGLVLWRVFLHPCGIVRYSINRLDKWLCLSPRNLSLQRNCSGCVLQSPRRAPKMTCKLFHQQLSSAWYQWYQNMNVCTPVPPLA